MGASTSPSGRITPLRALLWSLFALSAVVALPDDFHRRADYYARAGSSAPSSQSTSAAPSSSAGSSSSSASFPRSSSVSSTSSPISSSSSSSSSSLPHSSSSSTSTSSSSTSVITTATTSSRSSSSSSQSLSSKSVLTSVTSTSTSTSQTTANLVAPLTTTPGPTSTQDNSPDIATNSNSEPTSTDSPANVNAASTGFWGNKGAVGGTFTVVALVVVGILVALGIILRRRAASHNSARDTFFDTKNPVEPGPGRLSAGPSMVSLGNEPLDAHATPNPNYGAADQYLVDTADYNVSYPPGASYDHTNTNYAPAADHANPGADQYYTAAADQYTPAANQQYAAEQDPYYADPNAYENYNQYYAAGAAPGDNVYSVSPNNNRPSLSPHPYSHPSHASNAPPSALRDFAGRDSAYQQSIDSFYGAAGGSAV